MTMSALILKVAVSPVGGSVETLTYNYTGSSIFDVNPGDDDFYFKAGSYCQSNEGKSPLGEVCEVRHGALHVEHVYEAASPEPEPESEPEPSGGSASTVASSTITFSAAHTTASLATPSASSTLTASSRRHRPLRPHLRPCPARPHPRRLPHCHPRRSCHHALPAPHPRRRRLRPRRRRPHPRRRRRSPSPPSSSEGVVKSSTVIQYTL